MSDVYVQIIAKCGGNLKADGQVAVTSASIRFLLANMPR